MKLLYLKKMIYRDVNNKKKGKTQKKINCANINQFYFFILFFLSAKKKKTNENMLIT